MNILKQLKLGLVTLASIGMIAACGGSSSNVSSSSSVNKVVGTTTCPKGLDLVFGQHFASEEDRMRLASGAESASSEDDPFHIFLTGDLAKTVTLTDNQASEAGVASGTKASLAMAIFTESLFDENSGSPDSPVIVFGYVSVNDRELIEVIPGFVPFKTNNMAMITDPNAHAETWTKIQETGSELTPDNVLKFFEDNSEKKVKDFVMQQIFELFKETNDLPWYYFVIDFDGSSEEEMISNIELVNMKWGDNAEAKERANNYSKQLHEYYGHLVSNYTSIMVIFL